MRTETMPYQSLKHQGYNLKDGGSLNLLAFKISHLIAPIGFLLGRATMTGGIAPYGLAFFACTVGTEINKVLLGLAVFIGMMSSGDLSGTYINMIAILLFYLFSLPLKENKPNANMKCALIAVLSISIPELIKIYWGGLLLYDVIQIVFQSFILFCMVFIFRVGTTVIIESRYRQVFTNEEIISISIIFVLALSGLSNMKVFDFDISYIICTLIILLFSYKCGSGIGASIGVTIGLIASISGMLEPITVVIYSVSGLLGGVFRKLGRIGTCLGFVSGNLLLTLYLYEVGQGFINLKEFIVCAIVFFLIPESIIESTVGIFGKSETNSPDKHSYSLRIKELTVGRLDKFSRTFKELSKTFQEISETKVVTDKQDISILFDRVADKVCKDCGLAGHCWERNFYNTYQIMFKIVERLDSKGRLDREDIPEYFLDRCERVREFIQAVNNIYEIFKVDMVWKSKIGESRGLVSQQLEGLSRVISNLATEIDVEVSFKSDIEEALISSLNKSGIPTKEVIVFENSYGKYDISVFHKGCGGKRNCITSISKIASEVVGRKMIKESTECNRKYKGNMCVLKLIEEEKFRVTTGVAKAAKNNEEVSGDSYTFLSNGDGKYIVALSDGMGSGQRASNQSKATMNLLEQFMESGFDKDTTIKLINSILVLKSSEDSFATIDLSVIDLYEADVEFVKIGAVPTYIKRDKRVEVVKSASLPAGILSNIETELVHKKLNSGDFIIMMSDGILDAMKKNDLEEDTLITFIDSIESSNPQQIADLILNKAYSNSDCKPCDDMMVIVAKVWKRCG